MFDVQLDARYPELIALEGIRRLELFYQSLDKLKDIYEDEKYKTKKK